MRWPGLVLLLALAVPAAAQEPLKVGVVDTVALFRDYPRRARFERAVEVERDAIRKELEAQRAALKFVGTGGRLDVGPGGEEWARLRDETRLRSYAFGQECERLQRRLLARVDQLTERLLDEIDVVVREHGEQRGYDLILRADRLDGPDVPGSELTARLRDRLRQGPRPQVVFHRSTVDVTAEVKRALTLVAATGRFAERDAELGLPPEQRGAVAKPPAWPHLAALAPPDAWREPARKGAPERTRWRAEVTLRGLGDATAPTGVVTVARLADDAGQELELALPPLPTTGPHTWAVRAGERVQLQLFRRKDGQRQGTAVAVRELPSGRLLLFYDDGICPPCGVEDRDDLTATLTPLPPPVDASEADAWEATTLRLDRGNDTVTLRDDDSPALVGRSGLVARVVRARVHTGLAPLQRESVGAWLVWRPAE